MNTVLKVFEEWLWQMSKRREFHCRWHCFGTIRERLKEGWPKGFWLNMGGEKYLCAYRRTNLPGKGTQWDGQTWQIGDESEKKLWRTVDSLWSVLALTGNQWGAWRKAFTSSCLHALKTGVTQTSRASRVGVQHGQSGQIPVYPVPLCSLAHWGIVSAHTAVSEGKSKLTITKEIFQLATVRISRKCTMV